MFSFIKNNLETSRKVFNSRNCSTDCNPSSWVTPAPVKPYPRSWIQPPYDLRVLEQLFVDRTIRTVKSFRNLVKSNWSQIVYTIFRLIWTQTDVRLGPNQSESGKYKLISVWFNKILLCVLCDTETAVCVSHKAYIYERLSKRKMGGSI